MIMITCLGMSFAQSFSFSSKNYTNYCANISVSFLVQPTEAFTFIWFATLQNFKVRYYLYNDIVEINKHDYQSQNFHINTKISFLN